MGNLANIILIMFLISSCSFVDRTDNHPADENPSQEMTKELCDSVRGHWNDCSSPCIGTDAEVCIEMCVAQCECGGIAGFGCPEDYSCRLTGKIADEMGACVKKNI